MNKEEQLKLREEAFKEDRERFFKVADTLDKQPKYAEHIEELEQLKQTWRDIPEQNDFPNITHPIELPTWFPKVYFASNFKKDEFQDEVEKRKRHLKPHQTETTVDLENSTN